MASIVRYGEGWRAYLHVSGNRETKLFRTRREAASWAAHREEELRTGGDFQTFEKAAEDWLALKLPKLESAANQRTVESSIRTHVLPVIGSRKLAEVTRKDLVSLVRAIADKGNIETAQRVGQRIREIFDHAVDCGQLESHPAADLARVLPKKSSRRMPSLPPAELPALMQAIAGYSEPVTRAGLLLLAHTFVRTTELIAAQWEEIQDPDTWVIPWQRMKVKKRRLPHVVPLTRQVKAILEDLRAMGDGSTYFVPSEVNPLCGISNNTLLYALYRLGYKGKMSGHGFRAVASTILNESGQWPRDVIERQLAHGEKDEVREAYNRAEYLPERRRMMEWWSNHLEAMTPSG